MDASEQHAPADAGLAGLHPLAAPSEPERILGAFLEWMERSGLDPYPAQEEAILEVMTDRHVVLSTPTGSGKSLVATALHFRGLCEGRRSVYAAPIKALTSEKFFALCELFGPENVGMLTGDASINPAAPVICCTTEVLSNMALRRGAALDFRYVVLDEFHYYADRDRGSAWQIPLITLRDAHFLLMSATLGNTAPIEARLREFTGREVAHVFSDERPVPLDWEYRETPLHETIEARLAAGDSPIYVVNFTQRECAERAQGLTSARISSRDERREIAAALAGFRFDTAYGKDLQRFVRHGIGVHHAGLLPKYRLLVERMAQQGLLKVILGTDTLGVGVNIPIRTVIFTKLCKFDGEKTTLLSARDFKQIAGRAGRKGFDERGSVVCQAPEHVIENLRLAARSSAAGGGKKPARKRAPTRGFVPWNRDTFQRLIHQPPEMLESRFEVGHGLVVCALQRTESDGTDERGYRAVIDTIERCHETDAVKRRLRRRAAALFRSLRRAGVVQLAPDPTTGRLDARVDPDLQFDFSLHDTLSLYLVDAVAALDPEASDYALDVLSVVEATLEDPRVVLRAQVEALRRELLARLKAEGVPYEERIERLDEVTHPKPAAEFVYESFAIFAASHPWVAGENIRPKSIAREMVVGCLEFGDFVARYGLARSEGVLLRYLSQVHNTLVKSIPAPAKTEAVFDVIAYLRTLLLRVDSSLVEAWESLVEPTDPADAAARDARPRFDLATEPRALAARVRAEAHVVVRALAAGDWEAAAAALRPDPGDPWGPDRLAEAVAPFLEEHGEIVFTPYARQSRFTRLVPLDPRRYRFSQVLVDPGFEELWALEGEVDLSRDRDPEGPILTLRRIGT